MNHLWGYILIGGIGCGVVGMWMLVQKLKRQLDMPYRAEKDYWAELKKALKAALEEKP